MSSFLAGFHKAAMGAEALLDGNGVNNVGYWLLNAHKPPSDM